MNSFAARLAASGCNSVRVSLKHFFYYTNYLLKGTEKL